MVYRREIDGLRGIAVAVVILFHAGVYPFEGGYIGVDVFFVISGYLITSILLREYQDRDGKISYQNFVIRRARRILPALLTVIFVCILASIWLMTPYQLRNFGQSAIASLIFSSNILFWFESGYFAPLAELKPLLHTWSLAIEEQFYLVFPLIFIICLKRSRITLTVFVSILAVTGVALSVWITPFAPDAAFFLTPMRSWAILAGVLTSVYLYKGEKLHFHVITRELFAFFGLALLGFSALTYDSFTPYPGYHVIAPVVGSVILIIFANSQTVVGRILSIPFLVGIGLLSYSLYLWHQPVLVFMRMQILGELQLVDTFLALLITVVLSYFSWKYVERPFRNRQKVSNVSFITTISVVSVTILVSSFVFVYTRGIVGRYDAVTLNRLSELRQANTNRQYAMLADECHYNNRTGIGIRRFLDQWDCASVSQGIVGSDAVYVAGDSHAADIAVALRENSFPIVQVSGAGCSLDPLFMSNSCRQLFEELMPRALSKVSARLLIISNRYEGNEQNIESARRTWDYWKQHSDKVVILDGAIEMMNFDRSVAIDKVLSARNYVSEHKDSGLYFNYFLNNGAKVISRKDLYCALSEHCEYRDADGEMLMVDPDHMSIHGAKLFGRELLKILDSM